MHVLTQISCQAVTEIRLWYAMHFYSYLLRPQQKIHQLLKGTCDCNAEKYFKLLMLVTVGIINTINKTARIKD